MKKIYFAGSIRGGRDDAFLYLEIIEYLQKYGEVLTEHIGDPNLTASGEELTEVEIFKRDVGWISESDVIVAEVTQPSLGVGYEIGIGSNMGKKILCLFRPEDGKRLSAMIRGIQTVTVGEYGEISEVKEIIDEFFKEKL